MLSSAIGFFGLGLLLKDYKLSDNLVKFLSLYLLFAIGYKGGMAITENVEWLPIFLAFSFSALLPVPIYLATQSRELAATYGSISAVTFITATTYLPEWNEYMVLAMAIMEAPAIAVAFSLAEKRVVWVNEKTIAILLGSAAIAAVASDAAQIYDFIVLSFPVFLCFFLLAQGTEVRSEWKQLNRKSIGYGIIIPIVSASLAYGICSLLPVLPEDAFLLVVLAASGSYIAVPAALRTAGLPSGPATAMSLGVTFPFNVFVTLPVLSYLYGY